MTEAELNTLRALLHSINQLVVTAGAIVDRAAGQTEEKEEPEPVKPRPRFLGDDPPAA